MAFLAMIILAPAEQAANIEGARSALHQDEPSKQILRAVMQARLRYYQCRSYKSKLRELSCHVSAVLMGGVK
jgi:hypothetical protein